VIVDKKEKTKQQADNTQRHGAVEMILIENPYLRNTKSSRKTTSL